jgi:hypothetical protein
VPAVIPTSEGGKGMSNSEGIDTNNTNQQNKEGIHQKHTGQENTDMGQTNLKPHVHSTYKFLDLEHSHDKLGRDLLKYSENCSDYKSKFVNANEASLSTIYCLIL